MRKLLLAALAVIFVTPAFADDSLPNHVPSVDRNGNPLFITRQFGERSTMAATWDEIAFGFPSDYVTLCVHGDSEVPIYFRFGDTLSEEATTSTLFITGIAGDLPGRASVFYANTAPATAGATADICMTQPWRITGIVLHTENTGQATIDVNAYGH